MKSGFQLPENYWKEFSEKLDKRLHNAEEEKANEQLNISSGFSVPDNYFSDFNVEVESGQSKINYKQWLAIAAILIAFISLGIIQYNTYNQSETIDFSTIENKRINQYINNQEISEEVLDEYSKVNGENLKLEEAMQNIENEEILSYFDDQLNDLYAYED